MSKKDAAYENCAHCRRPIWSPKTAVYVHQKYFCTVRHYRAHYNLNMPIPDGKITTGYLLQLEEWERNNARPLS